MKNNMIIILIQISQDSLILNQFIDVTPSYIKELHYINSCYQEFCYYVCRVAFT